MRCLAPLEVVAGAVGVAADPPIGFSGFFLCTRQGGGRPRSGEPEGVQQEGGCDAGSDGGEEAQGGL